MSQTWSNITGQLNNYTQYFAIVVNFPSTHLFQKLHPLMKYPSPIAWHPCCKKEKETLIYIHVILQTHVAINYINKKLFLFKKMAAEITLILVIHTSLLSVHSFHVHVTKCCISINWMSFNHWKQRGKKWSSHDQFFFKLVHEQGIIIDASLVVKFCIYEQRTSLF